LDRALWLWRIKDDLLLLLQQKDDLLLLCRLLNAWRRIHSMNTDLKHS
jgi:hypothetical protein